MKKNISLLTRSALDLLLDKCWDGNSDIVGIAGFQHQQAQAEGLSRNPRFSRFGSGRDGIFRIDEERNRGGGGYQLVQQLNALGDDFNIDNGNSRSISTGSIEALDEAGLDRVGTHQESNRDGLRR